MQQGPTAFRAGLQPKSAPVQRLGRHVGARFGDVVVAVGGRSIEHPQVLLTAIRTAPADGKLDVTYHRQGQNLDAKISLTEREQEITSLSLQPLFSYSFQRGRTKTSFLFWLFGYESTEVAWEFDFLWFFSVGGGDRDRLREVDR